MSAHRRRFSTGGESHPLAGHRAMGQSTMFPSEGRNRGSPEQGGNAMVSSRPMKVPRRRDAKPRRKNSRHVDQGFQRPNEFNTLAEDFECDPANAACLTCLFSSVRSPAVPVPSSCTMLTRALYPAPKSAPASTCAAPAPSSRRSTSESVRRRTRSVPHRPFLSDGTFFAVPSFGCGDTPSTSYRWSATPGAG